MLLPEAEIVHGSTEVTISMVLSLKAGGSS